MEANLKITEIGSSVLVNWDNVKDGALYSLIVQDSQERTIRSIDTENRLLTIQDLKPDTITEVHSE